MANSNFVELELDYSATNVTDVVRSGVFSAGGHAWRIRCYPRGRKQLKAKNNVDDYISLFLELISKSSNVKTIFDAFLMRKDGKPSSSSRGKRCVQVYPQKGHRSWGWTKFVNLEEEESPELPSPSSSSYMVDGKVRIMCCVIVLGDSSIVTVPPPDIGVHLGRLMDNGDGTDVSFVVGGETFPAHRAVLAARSPVFRAELLGSMAEAKMSCITVHDIEPVAFRAMLRFIYTDELPTGDVELEEDSMTTELLQNLLAVADRYDLSRLKLMCVQKLWEAVSVDNVAVILMYAEMHGCPELKTSCLDFFVQEENFKEAVLNEGYAQLVQHFPSVIDEIKGLLGAKTIQWSEN